MSGFSAIDLSKLPAPDVVETLDFEVILQAMKDDLLSKDPDLTAVQLESEPITKLFEVAAYRELILRQRVNDAARSVMLAYALGADLEQLAAFYEVERLLVDPGDPNAVPPIPPVYESDEDFRKRIQLAPEAFTNAGSVGAYTFHALSADGNIKDIDVAFPTPVPGQVYVTVLSRTADGTADQSLLDTVESVLDGETVRPLCDTVIVRAATIINYTIDAILTMFPGPDSEVVKQAAEKAVNQYKEDRHRCGHDITLSGLYAALHQPGVQNVTLNQPVADIVINRDQAAYCTSVTVVVGGTDE